MPTPDYTQAFPSQAEWNSDRSKINRHYETGMGLRDYFAGIALPWALANVDVSQPWKLTACISAYEIADYMMEARKATK
jgi:hypothetical protein